MQMNLLYMLKLKEWNEISVPWSYFVKFYRARILHATLLILRINVPHEPCQVTEKGRIINW